MCSITFLLPRVSVYPVGGFKVIYEYANRFVKDGHEIHIVYPVSSFFKKKGIIYKFKSILKYPYYKIKGYSGKRWFQLDNRIKEHLTFSLNQYHVPKTSFYVATGVNTSIYLHKYNIPSENKLYLIQGYENWSSSDEEVINSYKYGMKNIVISNWLKEILIQNGASCTIIKNGFDFHYFQLTTPIKDKNKYCVTMLYHNQVLKGCKYGLEALSIVKNKYPQLKVNLFGCPKEPKDLPNYITYYNIPDRETHNKIYNEAAIYLAPSIEEGWGLTIGEAMICGAAIVCTNNKGFKEMAENEVTALISPIRDAQSLADNIIRLIEDDELRMNMAKQANQNIKKFTWDVSYNQFKSLIAND